MGTKFGEKIKERRIQRGWSISELSKMTGIHVSYIRKYEKGISLPNEKSRKIILEKLGIDYYDESIIEGKLYLVVSPDEYALPVFVAQSLDELSEMTGKPKKHILQMISKWKHVKNPIYMVVDVEEEEC